MHQVFLSYQRTYFIHVSSKLTVGAINQCALGLCHWSVNTLEDYLRPPLVQNLKRYLVNASP